MKPEVLKEMVRDWANIKRRQACDILGSPEAGELLADAKKFDLVVDFLTELGHTAQPAVAPTPEVPQGWKLVPVEPTSEMLSAVGKEMSWCNPVGIFRKMLAAAPAAPSRPAVPEAELRPEDFTVEVVGTQMGGLVPRAPHGVRVTHKPTGLSVSCDTERSQHKNRHIAFEQIKAMLANYSKDTLQPDVPGWCPGCHPGNCQGCGPCAASSQPAMQGEPVAQVSDLFPSIRTKLREMGFEPESPLDTAPADEPATPPYHRDLWGISHAIARINEAEYISTFMLDQEPATLTDDQRQQVFQDAEQRMMHDENLPWRNAIVDCVLAALNNRSRTNSREAGDFHPMQPVVMTDSGVVRFKKNQIVADLYELGAAHGLGLNEMALRKYSQEDRNQFAQLIGYSVAGWGTLSYALGVVEADAKAEIVIARSKGV